MIRIELTFGLLVGSSNGDVIATGRIMKVTYGPDPYDFIVYAARDGDLIELEGSDEFLILPLDPPSPN